MQLGFDAFCQIMEEFPEPAEKIAVAVSGGADSLALSLCLMDWTAKTGRKLVGISVDHGLRPEAARECEFVHSVFEQKGVEHHTLQWEGEKPAGSLQEAARNARFDLMKAFCQEHAIKDVFLAHHLDDQAETVILRLMRGSGVDGLSGIHKVQNLFGLRLMRPFLSVPKSDLIEYLHDYGQNWIEDPSNQNMSFDRVKVRKALKSLIDVGLTADRLALTAQNMQRTRRFLLSEQKAWIARNVTLHPQGYVHLGLKPVMGDDEDLVLRSLRQIGQSIGGQPQAPRLVRLKNLYATLKKSRSTTFMGCRWVVETDRVMVCREARNNLKATPANSHWDHRLQIDGLTPEHDALSYRGLGREGWDQIVRIQPEMKDKDLPFAVILSLFSIWQDETLLGVPHLEYWTSQGHDLGLSALNVRFNPLTKLFS